MKAYLLEKGVPEERIREESASTSTYENIQFSKRIIEEENLSRTVVIATQEFHQFRAQSFARRAGFTEAGPCTCRTPLHLLLCYWVPGIRRHLPYGAAGILTNNTTAPCVPKTYGAEFLS